jgi:hypothetical protein
MSILKSASHTNRYQTIQLFAEDEDGESLGSCSVEAADVITEFVMAGLGFFQEIVKDKVQQQPSEVDEDVNDRDSVLGTQDGPENLPEPESEEKTLSWDAIRASVIPSFVKDVTFTIAEGDSTTANLEQLQAQFSGVATAVETVFAAGEKARKELEQEKARIHQEKALFRQEKTLFEQERTYLEQEKARIEHEKAQGEAIDAKAGPNTSKKRVQQVNTTDPTTPRIVDPVQHIEDWAAYVKSPPSDEEFGYSYIISESWDKLPYTRKIEIGHARAIHQHHGKVLEENPCSHCAEQGKTCKVYSPQLANLRHMAFGLSCQNCRLQQISCDKDRRPSVPPLPRIDTQNVPSHRADAVSDTPPTTTVTPKPSLQSRITYDNSNGTPTSESEEREDTTSATPQYQTPTGPSGRASEILRFADEIGLDLPGKARTVIHAMYDKLKQAKETAPYGIHKHLSLQQHYENLVNLYILTSKKGEPDLAYIVLLRIQNTNYCCMEELPGVEIVVRAFDYLSPNSPLCRWFAILYSFLWSNEEDGEWYKFTKSHPMVKARPLALARLLYAITHTRDRLTMGGDSAVLRRWCEVHFHASPEEKERCDRMKSNLTLMPEDADRQENEKALERAQEVIRGLGSDPRPISSAGPSAPYVGGKRKAEDSPTHPHKMPYRGRGRPRGRGRGRGRGTG